MELKITELQLPGKISFNYEDLKQELTDKVKVYAAMVYSDDQIQAAKADRANLNRLKKALNDERIRQEKEFLQPFNEFKAQVKELCGIVDKASAAIDTQVKAFEDAQKQKKAEEIKAYWDSKEAPDWMRTNNPKWLNASYSMKTIAADIDGLLLSCQKDLNTLDSMGVCFEAVQKYQQTLDLNAAIAENARIQAQAEAKARWEAEHAQMQIWEEKPSALTNINDPDDIENLPARQWIGFQAYLSADEAKALGAWLRGNGIRYKAI